MFNATYFTYDGVFSGSYGLMIADFDDSSVIETPSFSPLLGTTKPARSNRFTHNGITYEEVPQHSFSIISAQIIPDVLRRDILSWLVGRSDFKTLHIHQPDLEDYDYRCVFTQTDNIYVNGQLHGFRVTANFDSPFQYGKPEEITVIGDGVQSKSITIYNRSDIKDDYVYPVVSFTPRGQIDGDADIAIKIFNTTDGIERPFEFRYSDDIKEGAQVTVDNELRYIRSINGERGLSSFNKNWLRLRHGANHLVVSINGTVTISCPTYTMLGF